MAVERDPLAHWPDRTRLTDDTGRTLLVYSPGESTRGGRPLADGVWRPDDVRLEDAVAASSQRLGGYAVSTPDPELAVSWQRAGADLLRHAHSMTHDLHQVAEPDPVDVAIHPLTPAQVARHARRLGEINAAAYPPGHPDHHNDTLDAALAEMGAISRGEALGPMLPASRVATHAGAIVGAVFIVDRPGSAPEGGPWVLDVFRDPGSPLRGVGRALLLAALHSAKRSALPSMTLVVSHGNEGARRLYASVGFVDRDESWTLALPAQ